MEVILTGGLQVSVANSILHVCGGDPDPFEDKMTPEEYSPRMWRQLFMANINIQKNCIHEV